MPPVRPCISILIFLIAILTSPSLSAQSWMHYGGDAGGSRYSPLTQITRENVKNLKVAWTYHTGDMSDGKGEYPVRSAFEATPLHVDGVLYLSTPFCRVIALEAETGKLLWEFDPGINRRRHGGLYANRGVAFWRRGESERIYLGTSDGKLFALDAKTGQPVQQFGQGGSIDLRKGITDRFEPVRLYGLSSPPLVFEDLVIVGSAVTDRMPQGPSGDVRAFNVDSGELVWRFHTVPRPGEVGHETWEGDSWRDRGGTNVWSAMSFDQERGIVYLPLTSPSADRWGGDRKGKNLFGNSLVALNARTGALLWYRQLVHHDLWDWDLPAQPLLVHIDREGVSVPAVVQLTKMGFAFVFNRVSGEPLFEIEERPVPASPVPGEQAWPTQPFPVKPAPFARQTFSREDLTDVTAESRAECLEIIESATMGRFFQPPGLEYTILFPGTNGGPNWGSGSFNPTTNRLFVNSMDVGQIVRMEEARQGSPTPYRSRGHRNGRFWDSNHYPCQKPPWGRLTAIDLSSGEHVWSVSLGVFDDLLKKGIPATGSPNIGGSMATAGGLVFIAATNDGRFRAFDSDSGEELWVTRLPASGHAVPMSFLGQKTGKQYVVIAAGGGNDYFDPVSDALVAFALP